MVEMPVGFYGAEIVTCDVHSFLWRKQICISSNKDGVNLINHEEPKTSLGLPPPTLVLQYHRACGSTIGKGLAKHEDLRSQTIIKGG